MEKMNARKKAARAARLRKQRTRRALLTLCLMLAVAVVSVGGTIAWLMDNTDPVVNTFTAGDINIDLDETTSDYKVIPGKDIDKDPVVTVEAGSEACWLFVKIDETDWSDKLTYAPASGWTALAGVDGVYYRAVAASSDNQEFAVLADDTVFVADTLSKEECEAMNTKNPVLTFTAYAVQQYGSETAADAWAKIPADQK